MSKNNVSKFYRIIIESKTYTVGYCESVDEAIEKFNSKHPDIDLDENHAEINVSRITW